MKKIEVNGKEYKIIKKYKNFILCEDKHGIKSCFDNFDLGLIKKRNIFEVRRNYTTDIENVWKIILVKIGGIQMITKKDLKNLMHLNQEIKFIEEKIKKHKPAEIVIDSVRASSPVFPYTEHTVKIEGIEQKKDTLSDYYRSLRECENKLKEEEMRIEKQIEKIPFSEIRQIIRLHYIDRLPYTQVMKIMGYNRRSDGIINRIKTPMKGAHPIYMGNKEIEIVLMPLQKNKYITDKETDLHYYDCYFPEVKKWMNIKH